MTSEEILGIGPLSPPVTGPGVKNKYLRAGLEENGIKIDWINTLEKRYQSFARIIKKASNYDYFLLSVSSKGRFLISPVLCSMISITSSRGILLPAGGEFAAELDQLPVGLSSIYKRCFSKFDAILPQTRQLTLDLNRHFSENDIIIERLPNLRPRPDKHPKPSDITNDKKEGLNLLYVGRIKKPKGISEMISGVQSVNEEFSNITLDIFGHFLPGDLFEQKFKKEVEGSESVQFKGEIINEEVINKMREYDMLLFPTYYPGEGFPGVIVEAFMAGIPVLATDWNYNSELIDHGYNGLLCEPKSSKAIADSIRYILQNKCHLENMKRHSWGSSKKYSVQSVTEDLIEIFKRSGWQVVL